MFKKQIIMQVLSEAQVISKIEAGEFFSARLDSQAFEIRIDNYRPLIGTAIHHGHRICSSLAERLQVTEVERQFEEDPYTGDLIATLPITLNVHDSRYYYDLNRHPDGCIYEKAWGKNVWKQPLDAEQIKKIKCLHDCYYRILHCLITTLERRFGCCILYDLHSYNYSRINGTAPLFNIGTHFINKAHYSTVLDHLLERLQRISIPGIENRAAFDQVFRGEGYQAAFMNEHHPLSLCLPLEIKKIFMNEHSFERNETVFIELKRQLQQVLTENGTFFEKTFANIPDRQE
jgi:N-formylglutamate amidohydrolase